MTTVQINLDEITQHMDELKDTKARLKFEMNNLEKEIEKEELKLVALLNKKQVNQMTYGIYSFGLKACERTAFDQKLFEEKHPDLYEKFKTTKQTEKFEFKVLAR